MIAVHLNCTLKLYHSRVMQQWINHFCKLQIMTASINSQGKKKAIVKTRKGIKSLPYPLERITVLLTPLLLGPPYGFCTYSPNFPSHPPKAGLLKSLGGISWGSSRQNFMVGYSTSVFSFHFSFFLSVNPPFSFILLCLCPQSLTLSPSFSPFCPLVSTLCSYALGLFVP